MFDFLKVRRYQLVTLLLLIEIGIFYAYPKAEKRPLGSPLSSVPSEWHGWQMVGETQLDTEVQALLRADESLNRVYARQGAMVNLFVAFFQTQRTGVSPHSPKVCLPGSGWVPVESNRIDIAVPGLEGPIHVNRYVVGKGDQRSLVLYWYQTPYRVIASEYAAKFFTILDGVRHLRSDTSLVRLVVATDENHLGEAERSAVQFAQEFYPRLREHLPK